MDTRNNKFITFNSASEITIIINTSLHIHALRLLRYYFSRFHLNIIHIENYTHEKILAKNSHFTIWVSDSIDTLPKTIITNEKNTVLTEGAFILRSMKFNQQPILLILGGDFSGIIYAINELGTKHLIISGQTVQIPSLDVYQTPALPYRFFWTWDHSTNWYLEQCGMQEIGFANPYSKPMNGFLEDYCRLIDFMSLHRINGITIYGFLRDSHGGIEAAQEL